MKILFTIFLFLVFSPQQVSNVGYEQQIGTLQEEFAQSFNDKRKTIEIQKEVFELAKGEEDIQRMLIASNYVGNTYSFLGEYESAIKHFNQSIELFNREANLSKETKQILRNAHLHKTRVLLSLGECYERLGDVENAFAYYEEALRFSGKEKDDFYILQAQTYLNELNKHIGNYGEIKKSASQFFKKIDKTNEAYEPTVDIAKARLGCSIADAYLHEGNVDSAIYVLNEIRENHHNILNVKSEIEKMYGDVLFGEGKYEQAIKQYEKARKIFVSHDAKVGAKKYGLELAKAYFNNGEHEKAIDELLLVKDEEDKSIFSRREEYKLLAESYRKSGENEKAAYYYSLFSELEQEAQQAKLSVSDSFAKQKQSSLKNEKRKIENLLLFSAPIALLLILSLVGYQLYDKGQKDKKVKSLLKRLEEAESAVKKENLVSPKDLPKEKAQGEEKKTEQNQGKQNNKISEQEMSRILAALKQLEEREFYLQMNCTAAVVAKEIQSNTTYLSKVINSHFNKNFSAYISDWRVNYALKRIKNDGQFRQFSIQGMANEIGFKSKESFNKAFKKQTGVLPSYFIKECERLSD